jgi:hypothetical protein
MSDIGPIRSVIKGKQVYSVLDRSRLKINGTLHVEFQDGQAHSIRLDRSATSKEFGIGWIAPGDPWYVNLVSNDVWPNHVQAVASALGDSVSEETIRQALDLAIRDLKPIDMGVAPFKFGGRLGQILAVTERLRLCETLQENDTFVKSHYCMPLVTYLLLTCFDVLGQGRGWLTPADWLKSTKGLHVKERLAALEHATPDREAAALTLLEAHSKIYGVKQAFVRFVLEVLPADSRDRLLRSIRATFLPYPPGVTQTAERDDKWKIDYLFAKRNTYTHRAQGIDAPHPSLFPREVFGDLGWVMHDHVRESGGGTTVAVWDWPKVLDGVVRDGLGSVVKKLASGGNSR